MTATKQTLGFQAEVKQLLDLMVHSLYSNKEIFLRELVSNASDACDKLRFEAISNPTHYESDPDLKVRVAFDKDARTITVSDNGVGMSRDEEGLTRALGEIPKLREEFWHAVSVPGAHSNLNQSLEYAGRVADYLEFAELLSLDALHRRESCGGHFREESQTADNEALRDDAKFSFVAAWEFKGVGHQPELHEEPLRFEEVHPTQRSYK